MSGVSGIFIRAQHTTIRRLVLFSAVAINAIVVSITCANAQSSASNPTAAPQQVELLDHWRRATVSIGQVGRDGSGNASYTTIGSGVLVATDEHHGCILTARHVVFDPQHAYAPSSTSIRLPTDRQSSESDMGIVVPLVASGQPLWRSDADGSDLAVFPAPDLSAYSNVHAVSLQNFGGEDDVFQGASILVLGYPAIAGEEHLATPLARGGIIAWTDPSGRLDKPFLADANFFNGNSGGPVFHMRNGLTRFGGVVLGGGLAFIGIVSKDGMIRTPVVAGDEPVGSIDPRTGKPTKLEVVVQNIGGIGVIEPALRARRLVETFCRAAQ